MSGAADRLVRLAKLRVYVPPHTRGTKGGVVNVEGYWRTISSVRDLTSEEASSIRSWGGGTSVKEAIPKVNREQHTFEVSHGVPAGGSERRVTPTADTFVGQRERSQGPSAKSLAMIDRAQSYPSPMQKVIDRYDMQRLPDEWGKGVTDPQARMRMGLPPSTPEARARADRATYPGISLEASKAATRQQDFREGRTSTPGNLPGGTTQSIAREAMQRSPETWGTPVQKKAVGYGVSLESPSVSGGKFWEAKIDGKKVTTRWGKVDTKGQTKVFNFDSAAEAAAYYDKKVNEKYGKGYQASGTEGAIGYPGEYESEGNDLFPDVSPSGLQGIEEEDLIDPDDAAPAVRSGVRGYGGAAAAEEALLLKEGVIGGGNVTASGHRPLSEIAADIRKDWGAKTNFGAKPYLSALGSLDDIKDNYGADSADMIVRYFLSNAKGWRGEKAKAIKAELNKILKMSAGGDGTVSFAREALGIVELTRVFIPPHKRKTATGVVDVDGYWRTVSNISELSDEDRKALESGERGRRSPELQAFMRNPAGVRAMETEIPSTAIDQQRRDARALVERIRGRGVTPALISRQAGVPTPTLRDSSFGKRKGVSTLASFDRPATATEKKRPSPPIDSFMKTMAERDWFADKLPTATDYQTKHKYAAFVKQGYDKTPGDLADFIAQQSQRTPSAKRWWDLSPSAFRKNLGQPPGPSDSAKGPQVFDLPGGGRGRGDRIEVRRTGRTGSGELWRIQQRTGNEPQGLLANRGVTVTDKTIETQEAVGPFDELVARARALAQRGRPSNERERTVGAMRGIQTKQRGTAVIKRNLRRIARRGR